jgi:hypothetical protein
MRIKIGTEIVFECDECGDNLETGTNDWDEALDYMRDNDWTAQKIDDVWCHFCFGCDQSVR